MRHEGISVGPFRLLQNCHLISMKIVQSSSFDSHLKCSIVNGILWGVDIIVIYFKNTLIEIFKNLFKKSQKHLKTVVKNFNNRHKILCNHQIISHPLRNNDFKCNHFTLHISQCSVFHSIDFECNYRRIMLT